MRPPRPVPVTSLAATPCSAISLRAAGNASGDGVDFVPGVSRADDGTGFGGAGAGCCFAAGVPPASCFAAGCAAAVAGAAAAAFASVSSTAMMSFDVTVVPSPFSTSTSTPSAGAGSSSTTLSVSMSMRFSSRLTASPAFLCQLTSVASATDSGSWGTLTSTRICLVLT